jgi:hypothetical protein
MNKLLLILSFSLIFKLSIAQELNCTVSVLSSGVQLSDKRVFKSMETAIREFMTNKRWTTDQFQRDERVELNLTFNITKFTMPDEMQGTLQIQSRRPVFNSNYGSVVMNFIDQDISFRYLEFQPIEFSDNAYISGLASLLGYYAYVALAMDYDSYSLEGGSAMWLKAQQVVNNAITDQAKGWKGTDIPPRNRFWLVENYLNPIYTPLRQANYLFHRQGMDNMYDKMDLGRTNIMEALRKIQTVNKQRPSSYNVQLFFNAKADEIINIYQQANPAEKAAVVQLLGELDPTNSNKYKKITQ